MKRYALVGGLAAQQNDETLDGQRKVLIAMSHTGWTLGAARIVLTSILIAACGSPQTSDDTGLAASGDPPGYLAGTQSRVITSSFGRTYQISVALPRGYEGSSRTYPVLYALDANGEFGTVVETARSLQLGGRVPELVLVGIGYPVGHFVDATGSRVKDLTLTEDLEYEAIYARELPNWPAPEGTGGAPEFLRFLTDELIPLVEDQYRVTPEDRALFGHSFGGLFAFHALLRGERAFQRFIIASPAFWWDNRISFQQEAAYAAANDSLPARVFLSVGMGEPDHAPVAPGGGRYVSNLREMAAVLESRDYQGFELRSEVYPGEYHMSVIPLSISAGLRHIYASR